MGLTLVSCNKYIFVMHHNATCLSFICIISHLPSVNEGIKPGYKITLIHSDSDEFFEIKCYTFDRKG